MEQADGRLGRFVSAPVGLARRLDAGVTSEPWHYAEVGTLTTYHNIRPNLFELAAPALDRPHLHCPQPESPQALFSASPALELNLRANHG